MHQEDATGSRDLDEAPCLAHDEQPEHSGTVQPDQDEASSPQGEAILGSLGDASTAALGIPGEDRGLHGGGDPTDEAPSNEESGYDGVAGPADGPLLSKAASEIGEDELPGGTSTLQPPRLRRLSTTDLPMEELLERHHQRLQLQCRDFRSRRRTADGACSSSTPAEAAPSMSSEDRPVTFPQPLEGAPPECQASVSFPSPLCLFRGAPC